MEKEKKTTYKQLLEKHLQKKNYVKFCRVFEEKELNIYGFILKISRDFLLIQIENEFLLNGYCIIKQDNYDSLQHNQLSRVRKKILQEEGILEKNYGIDNAINLKTWQTIFKDLKKFDYNVIIENEGLEEPTFDIGPIKRITKNSVSIHYHSPAAILENKLTSIKYKDITIVTFGDRYSSTYKKYLKPVT